MRHIAKLKRLRTCKEALEYAKSYKSMLAAWTDCDRGDWMLWLVGRTVKSLKSRKKLVLCACQCARLALKYVPRGELRPLRAIEAAESWARNEGATLSEVRAAADAAADADATTVAAGYAAATAYTAASTAYADASTDYAAYASAAYANIVRVAYPKPPRIGLEKP